MSPPPIFMAVGPEGSGIASLLVEMTGDAGARVLSPSRAGDGDDEGARGRWKSELASAAGCCLVVENLETLNAEQSASLRATLNSAHGGGAIGSPSSVHLSTDSLIGRPTADFIPYPQIFLFSARPAAADSLEKCLARFDFPKRSADAILARFSGCQRRSCFFALNVVDRTFTRLASGDGGKFAAACRADRARAAKTRGAAAKLLGLTARPDLAVALLDIVLPCLPPSTLSESDASVAMQDSKAGRWATGRVRPVVRVSLVDYVASVLDDEARDEPSEDLRAFHSFVTGRLAVPRMFLLNPLYAGKRVRRSLAEPGEREDDSEEEKEDSPTGEGRLGSAT